MIDEIIKTELKGFNLKELKGDEIMFKFAATKIVGLVMKATNRSVSGREVVEKIHSILEEMA